MGAGPGVAVPQDCSSQPFREGGEEGRMALECTLSAINSQAERTNFGVIPSELTVGLTVRCSDGQSLSELDPEGFRSLVWLEELQLRDCRIDKIPDRAFLGLTRLKSLTVSASPLSFQSASIVWRLTSCFPPDSNCCQGGAVHFERSL